MNYVTSGYEPRRVLEIFEEICAIPHGSGNEKGLADYIEKFAADIGLEAYRDSVGNVFVRKPAATGYEDCEPLLLQGHMDMVCEKNSASSHDFLTDGLKLSVKDGFLWADGTTLGGDDGIAVAMMLALLETDEHPTLECLFTVEEETGLAGAKGFDCSVITAKRMINLDSEEEDTITAGCAGGVRSEIDFGFSPISCPKEYETAVISVTGLAGGHSGAEIHCGKANAIIIAARLLATAYEKNRFNLVSLSCAGKDNAIARECFAVIASDNVGGIRDAISCEAEKIKKELALCDSGFNVNVRTAPVNDTECIDDKITKNILTFLSSIKIGVLKMSNDISGLVEFSRNIGVAETTRGNVKLTFSSRSSLEAQLDLSCREFDMLSSLAGASCRHYARYPGWEYAQVSPLRELYSSIYRDMFGKDMIISVIHAGLECGILSSKKSGLDIISIGPNMRCIHSPNEHLDINSCERVWKALLRLVKTK